MTLFLLEDLAALAAWMRDGRARAYPALVERGKLDADWAELDLLALTALAEDWRAALADEPRDPAVPDCTTALKRRAIESAIARFAARKADPPGMSAEEAEAVLAAMRQLGPAPWRPARPSGELAA